MNDIYANSHWVEDVPLTGFSNKALIIVQRISQVLRRVNNKNLALQDPMLGKTIVREVATSDDPRLHLLFDALLEELQKLAENRALPRYRGAIELHEEAPTSKKPVMYRGVASEESLTTTSEKKEVAKDESKPAPQKKKKMYRGVEI